MEGAVLILVYFIPAIVSALLARKRGRTVVGWFFIGLVLNWVGIILVLALPNLRQQNSDRERMEIEQMRLREQLQQERLKTEALRAHVAYRLDAHDGVLGMDTRALPSGMAEGPPQLQSPPSETGFALAADCDREWFYIKEGQRYGPISEEALRGLFRSTYIEADALVWTEGQFDWRPARQVAAFNNEFIP